MQDVANTEDTAERIRAAAIALFRVRGYHGTSTRDIAARAGITAGSLYNHYESKQSLLFDVLQASHRGALAALHAALTPGLQPEQALRAAVESHVRFHAEHQGAIAIAYQDMEFLTAEHRAEIVRLRREYESIVVDLIERGAQADQFAVGDPRLAAVAILSMGIRVAAWFRADGRLSAEQVATTYGQYALRIVGLAGAEQPELSGATAGRAE